MASIVVTMTPDEARLWRAQQKLIGQTKQLDTGYGRVKRSAKAAGDAAGKAGRQQRDFSGGASLRDLGLLAAGYGVITKAVQLATAALEEQNRVKREAAQLGRESAGGLGSLAQLANNPAEFAKLTKAARQTFAEGGAPDLASAANLVFNLESAGALGERKFFSQLGAANVVADPAKFAAATTVLQTAFGEGETGSLQAIASKAFGAGKYGLGSVENILAASARGAGSARALGVSDEELLAATAVLSKASGTPELGGTQIASLLRSLDQKGEFRGQSLRQSLKQLQAKGLEGDKLQEFLGRAEAVQAYRVLTLQQDTFGAAIAEVEQAQAENLAGVKIGLTRGDKTVNAAQIRRQAEAARVLANEGVGARENLVAAVLAQRGSEIGTAGQAFINVADPVSSLIYSAGDLVGLGGGDLREETYLQSYAQQGAFARGDPNRYRVGELARTAEEKRLLLAVLKRLEEMGVELTEGAREWRAAATENANETQAARTVAQTAGVD